ncbi:hypothetical protein BJV82DRAFT_484621, partial [Fennellomyces sp. T-0311]
VVLTDEHTAFLENLYDKDTSTTLKEAKQELKKHFDIDITQSGLQKHLVKKCGLTMKKLEKISEKRNDPATIKARMVWALALSHQNIDYMKCIFIDEAGFNLHIKRTFGRSKRGKPAKAVVPKNRGVTISILGAIA